MFGKVVILFHQQDGHVATAGQLADDFADLFDDRRLDAFGGFVQDQQFGLADQGATNGQLLLLAARQVAATAVFHLGQHRKHVVHPAGNLAPGLAGKARQAHF